MAKHARGKVPTGVSAMTRPNKYEWVMVAFGSVIIAAALYYASLAVKG